MLMRSFKSSSHKNPNYGFGGGAKNDLNNPSIPVVNGTETALRKVSFYLVGAGGIGVRVAPRSRELLLQPVPRAVS